MLEASAQPHSVAYSPCGWAGFLPQLPLPLPRSDIPSLVKMRQHCILACHATRRRATKDTFCSSSASTEVPWFPAGISTLLGLLLTTLELFQWSLRCFSFDVRMQKTPRGERNATWKPSTLFFLTAASREPWPRAARGSDEVCSQVM